MFKKNFSDVWQALLTGLWHLLNSARFPGLTLKGVSELTTENNQQRTTNGNQDAFFYEGHCNIYNEPT